MTSIRLIAFAAICEVAAGKTTRKRARVAGAFALCDNDFPMHIPLSRNFGAHFSKDKNESGENDC